MKLTADPYYYVYFCVFEEPAMFKPLSYSSEFVSIRQPFVLSTDNASFQAKNIRAGSPDLFMSMGEGVKNTLITKFPATRLKERHGTLLFLYLA